MQMEKWLLLWTYDFVLHCKYFDFHLFHFTHSFWHFLFLPWGQNLWFSSWPLDNGISCVKDWHLFIGPKLYIIQYLISIKTNNIYSFKLIGYIKYKFNIIKNNTDDANKLIVPKLIVYNGKISINNMIKSK
jgi:hypothetical protein